MKRIAILGSTGSIGTQALQIVDRYPERFQVTGLTAKTNAQLLLKQILQYRPLIAAIQDKDAYESICSSVPPETVLLWGEEAMLTVAAMEQAEILLVAVVGIAGLPAVMKGIESGKRIALANKEALVTGGRLVTEAIKARGDILYPVDSEHSAIFQCLQGQERSAVKSLILTASGGPFREYPKERLKEVTVADALQHPTWNMGKKITVDSATLMNKGLEVIEAAWLFDMAAADIRPVIHPESIVHSAVEFCDGAVIAQMGEPDMKLPILYALEYPARLDAGTPRLSLASRTKLTFFEPDYEKFPCLELAFEALKLGGNVPAALNAANEVAVEYFLREKIGFCDIPDIIEHTIFNMNVIENPTISDIYETDRMVRLQWKQEGQFE